MHRHRASALIIALGLSLTACGGRAPAPAATSPDGTPSASATSPGQSPATSPSTSASASSGPSPTPATPTPTVRTIVFTVTGKRVVPAPGRTRLRVGERVDLVIVTDRAVKVHIHTDPEIETRTAAGKPTVIPFSASRAGVYEVELHDPDLLVTRLVVD